jgi:hypothetical protein
MDTVLNSCIVSQLVNIGYCVYPVPSNSVVVLLALDDEKEREKAIHDIRMLCRTHPAENPSAVSFGAQSLYEEIKGEIIIRPAHWDICNVENPPLQFTLKDCNVDTASVGSKQRCSSLTKSNLRCNRMTFHESSVCWQHRIKRDNQHC